MAAAAESEEAKAGEATGEAAEAGGSGAERSSDDETEGEEEGGQGQGEGEGEEGEVLCPGDTQAVGGRSHSQADLGELGPGGTQVRARVRVGLGWVARVCLTPN